MAVYKEINRADGSGVTTFYRISDILDTAETDDQEGQAVVIDYNQAQNKPSINGVALVGNKTSEDLGLQPAGDYITNDEADAKFIDEDELLAYDYVNETQLEEALANIEHFHREIVNALPVTGKDNVLYMVRKEGSGEDIYNEYVWVGLSNSPDGYEFLGTTATDLTDYYKKSEVNTLLNNKVDKEYGKGLSEQNYTLAEKTKLAGLENYDDTEIQSHVATLSNTVSGLSTTSTSLNNRLTAIEPQVSNNASAVSTIYDLLDNKMTAIRLVEQGDGWVWMNLEGSRLTYAQASAALGHENCMLFIEQLENDGKVIPAEYKSEGDHINVIFKDLDSLIHVMTYGEDDVVVTQDVYPQDATLSWIVDDSAISYDATLDMIYGYSSHDYQFTDPTPDNQVPVWAVSDDVIIYARDLQASEFDEYVISLGNTELCSTYVIEDEDTIYQDYIHKVDGVWYIHREVGVWELDGTEDWIMSNGGLSQSTNKYFILQGYDNISVPGTIIWSDYFLCRGIWSTDTTGIEYATADSDYNFRIRINKSSVSSLQSWIASHHPRIYYTLPEPQEVEIVNPTLLAQLEAAQHIVQRGRQMHGIVDTNPAMKPIPYVKLTAITRIVTNSSDTVLGKDTYWNDEVPTQQDLPSNAQEGEIRIVQDTEDVYIYNGIKWVPFDKSSEVDLSNYLAKDNTTAWIPTGPFNPSTKKYVDDSISGIHVPTKTSQLQNDSNFVNKNANDLTNYYPKSNTYTKAEVDALIHSGGSEVQIVVVGDTLVITTTSAGGE